MIDDMRQRSCLYSTPATQLKDLWDDPPSLGVGFLTFRFCEVLLVLSCLGQAADVLASTTRSSATGSTLKAPLKLEQVPQGGVPDTDPHPRKKKRIKEQRSKATVRAPRRSHTVRPVLQSMGKLLAAPSGWVGGVGGNASKNPN